MLFLTGILTSLVVMFYYVYIMYTLFASDEATDKSVTSSIVVSPRTSEYFTNLGFTVKYPQYLSTATTVLWTFIICNLLFLI